MQFEDPNYQFAVALNDLCSPFEALRPPRRVSVSQGAADTLVIRQPGLAGGPWSADETPYMVEPMDTLASRKHEAEVFVGPARTGKTAGLLLGWMANNVVNDPGDMLMVQMTQDKAREFSKTDVARALLSPKLDAMKGITSKDDNTHDKMFKHGMWLRIAWPTVSNVSGSTYRYAAITDLDRMKNAENVDGEGPLFSLALKRTTTFLSRGMALAESSPGIDLVDPNWKPASPHEAPPTTGILGIYNRSDRRRWYWHCPDCREQFEAAPGLGLFNLPPEDQLLQDVRSVDIGEMAERYGSRIICPKCGSLIPAKMKSALNSGGRWITEAEIMGTKPSATIAGYWLGGVAAAYQSWKSLIERYLQGLREYALTGSEEVLKATTNTDQGMPYMSMHLREASRGARTPEERAENLPRYFVPPETRLLVASVDVQGGLSPRFVVQVHAVGTHFEQWLVNRFTISDSRRPGMGQEWAPLDPASYPEDWDRITEEVVRSTYRTPIEGKELKVLLTVIDTGGEDGVTDKAYAYRRRMKRAQLSKRIMLYKGATKGAHVVKESMLGINKDVPVYICNSNLLADAVSAGLNRQEPGPGYFHFPEVKSAKNPDGWLNQAFFEELKAEVRNADGTWTQIRKRNETFDLCKMIHAGLLRLGVDKAKFWDTPPPWALPLAENRELVTADDRREMKADLPVEQIAAPVVQAAAPPRRQRRMATSTYLR